MVNSIKVKDNGNLGYVIIPCCLFPLVFMAITLTFNLSYLITFLILLVVYTTYMIFILKYLQKQEGIYAITANETEVIFLNSGTYKWYEIKNIKPITSYSFLYNSRSKLIVNLVNGQNFKINLTNFDYSNDDLANILTNMGKLNS